jgi:hypothetical protein
MEASKGWWSGMAWQAKAHNPSLPLIIIFEYNASNEIELADRVFFKE